MLQDDGSGHQFGRHFKDVVKLCLQKDPTKRYGWQDSVWSVVVRRDLMSGALWCRYGRPGTAALLKHSFFKKAGETGFLAQSLLAKLEDIGESSMTAGIADALPGYVCVCCH